MEDRHKEYNLQHQGYEQWLKDKGFVLFGNIDVPPIKEQTYKSPEGIFIEPDYDVVCYQLRYTDEKLKTHSSYLPVDFHDKIVNERYEEFRRLVIKIKTERIKKIYCGMSGDAKVKMNIKKTD